MEMSEQKWISVEQELPEEWASVLLVRNGRVCYGYRRVLNKRSKRGEWRINGSWMEEVTYWMPLPAPPSTTEKGERG